ncbi:MAG: Gfo/Idh/MocA family oxidoreductase [Firmicutes bacterium]|nr:Gfo/Idh/MocA family oxidoreductase [Bacillota bacterium]
MILRVGVIGLGIGKRHIIEYNKIPGVQVVGVSDTDPDRLAEVQSEFDIRGYQSPLGMFESENLHAVSICTPPKSHLGLTLLAAKAGAHVLCEKPMAPTLGDCQEMINAAHESKVKLMLGFKKRFARAYRFLRERGEEWGRPIWAIYKFPIGYVDKEWFWARDDAQGPTVENTVHGVDLLRFLFGEVRRVYAETDNFLAGGYDAEDSTVFTLRFANRGMATVGGGCTSLWGFSTERLAIHYENAVAEVSGPLDEPRLLEYRLRGSGDVASLQCVDEDGFRGEIEHFITCIREDKEPIVSGQDGMRDLEVCLAILRSGRENRPVEI